MRIIEGTQITVQGKTAVVVLAKNIPAAWWEKTRGSAWCYSYLANDGTWMKGNLPSEWPHYGGGLDREVHSKSKDLAAIIPPRILDT